MSKRPATSGFENSMANKSRKLHLNYDLDPLVSLLKSNESSRVKAKRQNKKLQHNKIVEHAGQLKQRTKYLKPCLQKINSDTFKLMSDEISPSYEHTNPLVKSNRNLSSNLSHIDSSLFNTRQQVSQPEETLPNKKTVVHHSLSSTNSTSYKGFISVTSEQMTKFLQLLGMVLYFFPYIHII